MERNAPPCFLRTKRLLLANQTKRPLSANSAAFFLCDRAGPTPSPTNYSFGGVSNPMLPVLCPPSNPVLL